MTSAPRRRLAFATSVAAGLYAVLGATTPAAATFPGTGSLLTASNSGTIYGANLEPTRCDESGCQVLGANDAAWSPDGSRAAFISQQGDVQTVRYDDERDTWWIADAVDDGRGQGVVAERNDPTYLSDGDTVIWTEKMYGQPERLMMSSSTYGWQPVRFSPDDAFNYRLADGGPNGMVVFERWTTGVGDNQVWLWDGASFSKIIDGGDPSLSPDGKKIAFADGGWIKTANIDGTGVQSLGVTGSNPVWSPDGSTIAYNYGSGVRTIPAAGGTDTYAGLTGKAAWRSEHPDRLLRLADRDRYGTAMAISQAYWKTATDASDSRTPAKSVVLSRSDTFADALSGSALAAAKQGPLLLTPPTSLHAGTGAEIKRVLGSDTKAVVYLLGSPGALSTDVENAVRAMGYQVKRLAGADRFATSIAIANEIDPNPAYVLAATGMNFPDALSAGAAAGNYDRPGSADHAVIVLTNDAKLPTATKSYLDAHGSAKLFPVGNQAAAATAAYDGPTDDDGWAVAGKDRYETAMLVADTFFDAPYYAGVATGMNWPDALAGGALLGTLGSPLLLTLGTATSLNPSTAFKLSIESTSLSTVLVFGSAATVSDSLAKQAATSISGPAGFTTGTSGLSAGTMTATTGSTAKIAPSAEAVVSEQRLSPPKPARR